MGGQPKPQILGPAHSNDHGGNLLDAKWLCAKIEEPQNVHIRTAGMNPLGKFTVSYVLILENQPPTRVNG